MPVWDLNFRFILVVVDCSGRVGFSSCLVGVVRESRGRGCLWGVSHEGPSKVGKEKYGERKRSKVWFSV